MITGFKVAKAMSMRRNLKTKFGEIVKSDKTEKCYFCEREILEGSYCVCVKFGRKAQFSHLTCFEEYIIEYRSIIDETDEVINFLEEIKKEKYSSQLVMDSIRYENSEGI